MSSYQFVNSLASCYAGQQAQQQQQQQTRPTPTSPSEPLQAPSPAGGDYYNPNPANTGYPTPCYSPQQHYPQHPFATPATGMQHPPPTGMIDYTQLQPGPRINTASTTQHNLHAQQHHQHHPQSLIHPDQTAPLLQAGTTVSVPSTSSCKYSDSTSSTSVSSPQDLTTSTSRNSPTPQASTSKANLNLTSPSGISSRPSISATGSSPPSGSSRVIGESSTTLTTVSSASSPASSTSSTSSTGNNSSNKGNASGGNPPQIYPWMKRVHIGQSEFNYYYSYYFYLCVYHHHQK